MVLKNVPESIFIDRGARERDTLRESTGWKQASRLLIYPPIEFSLVLLAFQHSSQVNLATGIAYIILMGTTCVLTVSGCLR